MNELRADRQTGEHSFPVRLPPQLEDLISNALGEFAKQAEFDLRSLYHGDSLWVLRRADGNLTRRIQVGASGVFPFVELVFIPDAIQLDTPNAVMRMLPEVPRDAMQVLSWLEFLSPSAKPGSIVEAAWTAAKQASRIGTRDLTRVIALQPKPPE